MAKILGIHRPLNTVNLAINGAFDYWQEKGNNTTTVNTAATTTGYSADMFVVYSQGTTVKNYSYSRTGDVPTLAESGFSSPFSYVYNQLNTIASFAATDSIEPIIYRMEGYDYAKIHGKIATFSFWFKSSIPGTYGFSLRNLTDRTYATTFTVNVANVWEFKSITVQMETTGTWNFTNDIGLQVSVAGLGGSSVSISPTGAWQNVNLSTIAGATNWATAGASFRISQFSIVEGSLGVGPRGFVRAGLTTTEELQLCQRYYERTTAVSMSFSAGVIGSTGNGFPSWGLPSGPWKQTKRVNPTLLAFFSTSNFSFTSSGATLTSASFGDIRVEGDVEGYFWTFAQNDTSLPSFSYVYGLYATADSRL